MRTKHRYSFATQRLLDKNGEPLFKIFKDGKRILKYKLPRFPYWDIKPVDTRIRIGQPLFKGEITKTKTIDNYDDLLHYGIMISKRSPRYQRFFGQKIEYYLTKRSTLKPDIGDIPEGHSIEINPQTREFRLVNNIRGFASEWFNPFPRKQGQYYGSKSVFDSTAFDYRDTMKKYLNITEEERYSDYIEEIVLGISDDGRLICIREEKENPTIGIVGHKRFGKSLIAHRIMDNVYWKWHKKIIQLNDILKETDSYCQTWNPITKFSNIQLINEHSIPLPMVYLHPKTQTLRNLIAPEETGFETYISYQDFILNYNDILKGRDDLTLVKSGIYFRNLLYDKNGKIDPEGLYYAKNYAEQEAIILKKMFRKGEDLDEEKQRKIPEGVVPKILEVLKYMDNAKILDISNDAKAKWNVQFPDGHKEQYYAWTACIIADLVPSIVTDNLSTSHSEFHPQISNFILKDLFKNQTENPYFDENKIELFMFFDEILSLVNSLIAVETFKRIIRESGHKLIAFTYCTQSWKEIPEFIRSQTDYIIAFNQTKNWSKSICEDFSALKHKEKEMVNLNKGEFIIFSKNPIILIDEYGKKDEVEGEAIKGTIFPSLSAHKAPKSIGA